MPQWTTGSSWVKLATRVTDYTEDFRDISDAGKLTFFTLLAAAPKQNNVFPNTMDSLHDILGIATIELDELLKGEFIEIVNEQQMFDGFEPPIVTENTKNQEDIDTLVTAWNEMAQLCGLSERTRVKYRGAVYKSIVTRFKEPEWVADYPRALEAIPGLELLTKPGSIGTRKWRANFDWFVQIRSVEMIMNGKYGTPEQKEGMYVNDDNDI